MAHGQNWISVDNYSWFNQDMATMVSKDLYLIQTECYCTYFIFLPSCSPSICASLTGFYLMSVFVSVQKCMMCIGAGERTGKCGESLEAVCSAGE